MTPVPFSAVCFDMDGVLIQSRDVIEQSWASVARAYGVNLTDDHIQDHIHGRPGSYTLNALFGNFSETKRQVIKQRVDAAEETARCPLLPGVAELLTALQRARVPIALVTSSWPARIHFVLRLHGLEHVFDTIVSREDVPHGKPDPACYRLAANLLGVAPDDCLVFEDSQSGVKAAVQSGARCIGIGDDTGLHQHGAIAQYRDFHALQPHFGAGPGHAVDAQTDAALLNLAEHPLPRALRP